MLNGSRRTSSALLLVALGSISCNATATPSSTAGTPAVRVVSIVGGPPNENIARSSIGMVVSGAPLATAVGVRVLEEGGNAVDAAVALAFALSVVEPSQSGIGGRTQLLLRTSAGLVAAIDGTTLALGYVSAPVVHAGTEHWCGFRPDRITGLAAAITA
jgi:gamma-glutamyltranspeptidase/glutathione hydrolase